MDEQLPALALFLEVSNPRTDRESKQSWQGPNILLHVPGTCSGTLCNACRRLTGDIQCNGHGSSVCLGMLSSTAYGCCKSPSDLPLRDKVVDVI